MHKAIMSALILAGSGSAHAQDSTAQLPPVVVKGSGGYSPASADSTSRTAIPIMDLPASIQVVPGEVLRDRGVTRTDQLLENVSGVLAESSYGGNGGTFFSIRGFSETNGLRDGFRNFGYFAFRDVQNIDRVEVFKGPAGALYGGVGAVGGYIDTVSKRPGRQNFGEVGMTVGGYGLARTTLDVNRVVNDDLSLRLNAALENNAGFRDNAGDDSWSIAPSMRWDDREGTSLTLLTEFNHLRRDGFDFGVPNVPDYQELSRTRYYGLRDGVYPGVAGDFGRNDTQSATLLYDQVLTADWTLRAGAQYTDARQLSTQTFPNGTVANGNRLDYSVYSGSDEVSRQYAGQVEVLGKLSTGGIAHSLLAGVDYGRFTEGSKGWGISTLTLDLFDPGYVSALTPADPLASHHGKSRDLGVYVQDLFELTRRFKLFLGARGDRFDTRAFASDAQTGHARQTVFSPRVGLVWQPGDRTSLFTDWSRSHAPNVGHSDRNATYDAEIADQVEIGVKRELIEDRLDATLALFDLKRSNVLTVDPSNPFLQVLTGQQRSRGVEVDLAGAITPGWKVIASYEYTDAVVESDTTFPVGDALSNVPRHHASVWSTYRLPAVPGLGVGAGVYYVGEREATLPNTWKLAGYVRTDAVVSYETGAWRAQLNVFNLFDRRYYTGGSTAVFNDTLDPSRPRSAQLAMTYRF